jgi:hypothetical protein
MAGAVLIAIDVPRRGNLDAEGRRILFTLAGVGIAIIVRLLANLLQRSHKPTTTPASRFHSATSA